MKLWDGGHNELSWNPYPYFLGVFANETCSLAGWPHVAETSENQTEHPAWVRLRNSHHSTFELTGFLFLRKFAP